jgi:hypothetical protein
VDSGGALLVSYRFVGPIPQFGGGIELLQAGGGSASGAGAMAGAGGARGAVGSTAVGFRLFVTVHSATEIKDLQVQYLHSL